MAAKSNSRSGARAQQAAHDGKRAFDHLAEAAQEGLDELREAAAGQAGEWQRGLESSIRQEPVKAVLIAAGVGLVLGLLLRR